jgi:predicted RNase H-like HicB family nuclease
MAIQLNVVIEKDANGFYAYCPELPGCQSQGDSFEEIMTNIRESAAFYRDVAGAGEATAGQKADSDNGHGGIGCLGRHGSLPQTRSGCFFAPDSR